MLQQERFASHKLYLCVLGNADSASPADVDGTDVPQHHYEVVQLTASKMSICQLPCRI